MEVQDIHVGSQLHVCSTVGGEALGVAAPGLRDPTALGVGPAAIPGSIYSNGVGILGKELRHAKR